MTSANNTISHDNFEKTLGMAWLDITGQEKEAIHTQLDEALKAIKVFDELDLKNVAPLEHPGGLSNVMREDVVTPSFTQAEALQNAPDQHNGFVKVPHVLGEVSA
jgi:aspartyl-tRNA(Asn)/glutamyl-tRNA(Gln) amidotransferase subunit C